MAAVRAGVGREVAHEAIKEHAVAVALEMREEGAEGNDLLDRLAADARLGLGPDQLAGVVAGPLDFVGRARTQVAAFVGRGRGPGGGRSRGRRLPPRRHPVAGGALARLR